MRAVAPLFAVASMLAIVPCASAQPRVVEVEMVPVERAQLAVWIEQTDGTYLRTLALTQSVSYRGIGNRPGASQMNSGFRWPYGRREGVLPVWAHRRAGAPGATLFPRVIFQDRASEGDASRTSNDFSRDNYFCLSFNQATTSRDALDAVTCASTFNSDKGRYLTMDDVGRGYAEPSESTPGAGAMRPLELLSYYPPRRDVMQCATGGSCYDRAEVAGYATDARRIFPEIDAVTMATQPGGMPLRIPFTLPDEWPNGEYVVWIEVNTEGDYNTEWDDHTYPTPHNPSGQWDYWAQNYGYAYRGQPSVVYRVPISVAGISMTATVTDPEGYGSLSGQGTDGGAIHTMDPSISNDPMSAPGSGADRLIASTDGWRAQVTVVGPEVCMVNTPPEGIMDLEVTQYADRHVAHRYAHLSFLAPADDVGIDHYDVRVSLSPITDEQSFMRAPPAQAASLMIEGLQVPVSAAAGTRVGVDFGGLIPETHYWVAMRAFDRCNAGGPIAMAEYDTPTIQFTTVSPCFVATAAYGTPMAAEISALRRLRDRHLRTNAPGRAFVSAYEVIGPVLADWIRQDDNRRAAARALLAPIVAVAQHVD